MSDIAIEVNNVWKRFRKGERATSLRDAIPKAVRWLKGANGQNLGKQDFWALKDVSFQVKRGQTLGIIGANGAGKSTILKILAGIMRPNKGSVTVNGRLSALIEVGAGFNDDLTGRENVYLNASIMGLKKREIDAKFDQIVEFAGVGEFIDTPLKRYSSGMQVRLGFAVAAHLDPDILIVDEVLAVGDTEFQRKCLRTMEEATVGGRTVLLVSHNMGAISALCEEAILLSHGSLIDAGQTDDVIARYLQDVSPSDGRVELSAFESRSGHGPMHLLSAATMHADGRMTSHFKMGQDLVLEMDLSTPTRVACADLAVLVKTSTGIPVWHLVDRDSAFKLPAFDGKRTVRVTVPQLALYPGTYLISIWVGDDMGPTTYDFAQDCIIFDVVEGDSMLRGNLSWKYGVVACASQWELTE